MTVTDNRAVTMTDDEARILTGGCFGLQFTPGDEHCVRICQVRDRCIRALGQHIPRVKEMAGRPDMAIGEIAAACDSDELGIKLAMEVARGRSLAGLLPPQAVPPVPPPESETTEEEVDALLEDLAKPVVQTPAPVVQPPALAALEQDVKKKSPKKTAPVKKPTTKATPPAKKTPRPDVLAQLAASKVTKKAVQRPGVSPRASELTPFQAERARSSFAAGLQDGGMLTRQFEGRELRVKIDTKNECYHFEGKRYPTLYGLVVDLTGGIETPTGKVTSKWSLKKFWNRNG